MSRATRPRRVAPAIPVNGLVDLGAWARRGAARVRRRTPPATIVLADDHRLVRQGLRALLDAEPGLRVVGEAADGFEAIRAVEHLRPSVLVLDLMMPRLGGMQVAREVTRRFPETRLLVLSMHAEDAYVSEALGSGALGYVLKASSADELVKAIREVIAGRRYLGSGLSASGVEAYAAKTRNVPLDPYAALTAREREVLQLVAEGRTSVEIAARLSISPRTIETHRANLMHKLGLHTPAELIRFALMRGIARIDR